MNAKEAVERVPSICQHEVRVEKEKRNLRTATLDRVSECTRCGHTVRISQTPDVVKPQQS